MLSSELSGRARKLEKEQQQRIEKARQRLERERLLEARARQQRQALDDASRSRRTAALEAEEAVKCCKAPCCNIRPHSVPKSLA